MATNVGSKASIPNPALAPFAAFIGDWQTTGFHPLVPDLALRGRASFAWLEGGAFVIARSDIDDPRFPDGIEIFGSDDVAGTLFMLHFDERGTSRKYDVTVTGTTLAWRRDEPSFSQHFTLTVEDGGNRMVSNGQMSRNGAAWEKDLALTYTRIG